MTRRCALSCLLLLAVLAGCASQPADKDVPSVAESDKEKASELYAGQPAVVHATEFPVASAAEGLARGDAAWREGKLDLAVYLYVQSIAFDATAPEPFLKIGAVHEQLGNRGLAAKAYELGLERQPEHAGACERLGLLYLQDGRNDDAAALFRRATKLDDKRWRSYNGLGVVADRQEDFDAALKFYGKALAIDPKAAQVLNNRGYSRFLAGDVVGAEADLKEAIRLGAAGGVYTNLARVQARQGRYAEALENLTHEMDIAHAYDALGEAAMDAGDFAAAKRYFEQAISAAPRYFETAQKHLALANERLLAAPPAASIMVVLADTPVYAGGDVIGLVEKGDRVEALRSQQGSTLVRFRTRTGAEHLGWVTTGRLAVRN